MKKKDNKLTATEKVATGADNWIGRHRVLLIVISIVVLVLVIAVGAVFITLDILETKRDEQFDDVMSQWENLKTTDAEDEEYDVLVASFLDSATALSNRSGSSYAVVRTNLMLGDYYFDEENYTQALEYYQKVIDKQPDSYLSQMSKMNQAAIYENQGDINSAIDIYNSLWDDYGKDGLYGSRALFNAARLYEAIGDQELALATYEQLVGEYNSLNSEYSRLGETRIAQLTSGNGTYEYERGSVVESSTEDFTIERTIGESIALNVVAGPVSATITYPEELSLEDVESAFAALDEAYPGRYSDLNIYWTGDGTASLEYPRLTEAELNAELDQIEKDLNAYISSLN